MPEPAMPAMRPLTGSSPSRSVMTSRPLRPTAVSTVSAELSVRGGASCRLVYVSVARAATARAATRSSNIAGGGWSSTTVVAPVGGCARRHQRRRSGCPSRRGRVRAPRRPASSGPSRRVQVPGRRAPRPAPEGLARDRAVGPGGRGPRTRRPCADRRAGSRGASDGNRADTLRRPRWRGHPVRSASPRVRGCQT